ncbi:MAG: YggS family pyridoxal phosphate-dependent enzyme [Peptococcaceae bacterium]
MDITANFKRIKEEIQDSAAKSNRASKDVNLIVVTKNRSVQEITEILKLGHFVLGENRVQELKDKHEQLPPDLEWHLIGHLQRNKVKYITERVKLIHSLDSIALAAEIDKRMEQNGGEMNCLIQVNVAEEASKYGIKAGELRAFAREVSLFNRIRIKGLMTIAPEVDNPEEVRPVFRELKRLFEDLKNLNIPLIEMKYLSMGMTNDFKIAIEEGANMVRIGSAIFGPRY